MIKEELYSKILVFHSALKNTDNFIEKITKSQNFVDPWHDWYDLGKQTFFKNYPNYFSNTFPTNNDWHENCKKSNNELAIQIANIFYESTKIFVEENDIKIPNWLHSSPAICKHFAKTKNKSLAMQYHTDFIMAQAENPGFKHWITCCIYLNDDYDNGEISFKIFKNDLSYDLINYKPKSGDVLVFPSFSPYFHGVKKALNKEKYFIRLFWGYNYEGSAKWLEDQKLYGEKIWQEMEEKRIKYECETSMWMKGHIEE